MKAITKRNSGIRSHSEFWKSSSSKIEPGESTNGTMNMQIHNFPEYSYLVFPFPLNLRSFLSIFLGTPLSLKMLAKTHFLEIETLILSIVQSMDKIMVVNVDLKLFCIQTGMTVINMFFTCKKNIKIKVVLSGAISRRKQ